jgi:hypothetical protein
MGYQPFLIGNFRTGLNMAVEPWLLPRDAFQSLINARLYRGVVEKVSGYSPYARTYEGVISRLFPAPNGTNQTFTATLGRTPRTVNFAGYAVITTGLNSEIFTYQSDSIVSGQPVVVLKGSGLTGSGTLNLATNALSITTTVPPPAGSTVIFKYWANPTNVSTRYPIMGIKPYYTPLGESQTLVFDYQKMCVIASQNTTAVSPTIFATTERLNNAAVEVPHDYYSSATITGNGITKTFSGTFTNPIVPGTVNFYQFLSTGAPVPASSFDDNVADISDNAQGALTGIGASAGSGSIDYYTGVWTFTFLTAPATGNYFDSTVGVFGQVFHGGNKNFFSVANYQNKAFICNNYDPVFYYDGSTLKFLRTNLTVTPITSAGGVPNNTSPYITSALHVFVNRERLLLLSPRVILDVVGQTLQSTGVYWSDTSNPLVWTNGGALFGPTSQPIITAGFVNSDLIVRFTNSEAVFRYTGDAFGPFRFDPTNNIWNCSSQHGTISYDSWISSVGTSAIVGSDGWNIKRVDDAIPDFTDAYRIPGQYPIPYLSEPDIEYCYGQRFDDVKEGWLCYVSDIPNPVSEALTFSDNVLAFNYLDGTYSIYSFPLTCLGVSTSTDSLETWGTIFTDWEQHQDTWGSYQQIKGSLIDLGGDSLGYVHELNDGQLIYQGASGEDFDLTLITKDFNPFIEQGQLCRLGYIDFLVSTFDDELEFDVSIYCNNNLSAIPTPGFPFQTNSFDYTVTVAATDAMSPYFAQEKAWVRVYVGLVAKSHTIKITQIGDHNTNPLNLHAMTLYMQPAGRLFN